MSCAEQEGPRRGTGTPKAAVAPSSGRNRRLSRRLRITAPIAYGAYFLSLAEPAAATEALSIQEVERRLKVCFEAGQYYVSGNLDRGIFTENCVFTDPTIKVTGVHRTTSVDGACCCTRAHVHMGRCVCVPFLQRLTG